MRTLKDFLKEMGLEGVNPKDTTRKLHEAIMKDIMERHTKPEYMNPGFYINPRDHNGEVPF